MSSLFPRMVEILQPSTVGTAKIDHLEITKHDSELLKLRAILNWNPDEYCRPGTYARLWVNDEVMMTDTLMEQRSNEEVVEKAKGRVLIAGLGLGMILHPICKKESVKSVHVVEKNADVMGLIAKTIPFKARVVKGDIFTWRAGAGIKYDTIYFDIWPHLVETNLKEIAKLRKRFRRRLAEGGWMGAWKEEELKAKRARATRLDPFHGLVKCGGHNVEGRT
jgi:spermidine synthase